MNESDATTITKPPPARKWRWFRFSLRTFLLVVTVLCVWLGWKINAAREQRQAVAEVRALDAHVRYDFEIVPGLLAKSPHPEPGWYAKLLGLDYFYDVRELGSNWNASKDVAAVLPHLRQLARIRTVMLDDVKLSDHDLQYLADLNELELLWLTNNNITGEGFKYLVKLRKLKMISVKGNPIVDQSLEAISTLPELVHLGLNKTNVTDACIATLGKFPSLQTIDVDGSRITVDGVRRLQQLRPNLSVRFWPEQNPDSVRPDGIAK